MHNWFITTVKFEKTVEEGKIVKVNETYLVDALSFAEAEERITKEMQPFISGSSLITTVRRARINELFENESGDRWYRCKVNLITLDEEKGLEKRTAITMMAQAGTVKEALEVLEKGMKGTMADYEIASITETNILDVFVYEAKG